MDRQPLTPPRARPACVGIEDAARIFGWPQYYLPMLMCAGHLKPLGKPMQNGRKWFATVDIEQASANPDWLDKAIGIIGKSINEKNSKQRGKLGDGAGE